MERNGGWGDLILVDVEMASGALYHHHHLHKFFRVCKYLETFFGHHPNHKELRYMHRAAGCWSRVRAILANPSLAISIVSSRLTGFVPRSTQGYLGIHLYGTGAEELTVTV